MRVSVIIATFNRATLLESCLAYIERQPFATGDEVIVVDNGSTDHTARIVDEAAQRFGVPVRYLYEPEPGKSRALARALAIAAGDILAFTDDDVQVGPLWLAAIRNRLQDGTVALMGGPVVAMWERTPPRWLHHVEQGSGRLSAPLALVNYGSEVIDLGPRTVLGANMAVRRDVMQQVGGFARHLGKLRGTLLSGEDHDLCRRVQAAGFRAVYDPAASVRHWVPRERMRLAYYASWFFWSGITYAALDDAERTSGRSICGVPLYLFKRAVAAGPAAATSAVTGDLAGAVERLVDIAFAIGYTSRRWCWSARRSRFTLSGDRA
jgi:glycosyltransferase involved in cell wall biosynthesis